MTKKKDITLDDFAPVTTAFDTKMPNVQQSADLETMFDLVLAKTKAGNFRDFIESLYEQFQESGTLSERQSDALEKAYFNCLRPYRRKVW